VQGRVFLFLCVSFSFSIFLFKLHTLKSQNQRSRLWAFQSRCYNRFFGGSMEASALRSAPRVVIVGGGFGGLFATQALARAPVSVTLVDKRNYHLFRPMLYQVATGLLSADQIAGPLRSILRKQRNVEVLQDEVSGIDAQNRLVHLRQHEIPYDYLILATGIQYNYFGHDEWRHVAPGLESLDDADLIRGKVLTAFERARSLRYGAN